jgi:hypothetical protein
VLEQPRGLARHVWPNRRRPAVVVRRAGLRGGLFARGRGHGATAQRPARARAAAVAWFAASGRACASSAVAATRRPAGRRPRGQ